MKTLKEEKEVDPRDYVSAEEMKEIEENFFNGDKPTYTLEETMIMAKRENLHKNRR